MSMLNNVELKEKDKLVDECFKYISKEQIEQFFGIRIRLYGCDKDNIPMYNIYKGDKLIFGKKNSWDVQQILEFISCRCANLLCETAKKDENHEAASKKADELEARELEYEEKYYVTCPICNITYNSKTEDHFHL